MSVGKTKKEWALKLAEMGFYVFKLRPNSKLPALTRYTEKATRDSGIISRWWDQDPDANIGMITSKFGDGSEALLVADVDTKGGYNGYDTVRELERQGFSFGHTLTQDTPSGGCHFIFRTPQAVRQSVGAIGRGIDIRSRGGYIVGPGSTLAGKAYTLRDGSVSVAPTWIVERCEEGYGKLPPTKPEFYESAIIQAERYLKYAPIALAGNGGNQTTFKVAARLKDFGVSCSLAKGLMFAAWNEKCQPPWDYQELALIIENAYTYGASPAGSLAPENVFQDVVGEPDKPKEDKPLKKNEVDSDTDDEPEGPIAAMNRSHAFVLAGGGHHIIWETKDAKGNPRLEHLNELTFHRKYASDTIQVGNKSEPVTKLWMRSKKRRSYDGFVFRPEQKTPPNLYNLWHGFSVSPVEGEPKHESLDQFLEHARENVCGGNEKLFRWLVGYFAHLVQKPWEKPLTALVFRGKKGVGKNALVDRIGHLLGGHYLSTPDRRYLVGNFNGHLENCLLFTLDEAFWSGDKQAEGVLKSVITSNTHNIEHKGKEIYSVDNCTRVVILGNEDWLVPATHDERRYAVFQVGEGRKQDRQFFESMRTGMERGGYSHLLKFLKDFDLLGIDINEVPKTKALLDQKEESLELFDRFWLTCLKQGSISDDADWSEEVLCSTLRNAFQNFCREKNIRSRLPDNLRIGKRLRDLCGALKGRKREGTELVYTYSIPKLSHCRASWSLHIGHEMEWDSDC